MSDLDTEIEGDPAAVLAVGQWLRADLAAGFTRLGSTVAAQRTTAAGDWQGEAATAFSGRTGTLVDASDDGATTSGRAGALVEGLAADLRAALDAMAAVRTRARGGGLVVDGFWVRSPGPGPRSAGPVPPADAPQAVIDDWVAAEDAVRAHAAKVAVWDECVRLANEAHRTWLEALEAAASAWREHDVSYVGLSSGLLSAGLQLDIVRRTTPVLLGEVDGMLERARRLRGHADALRTPDGRVVDPPRFYELMDQADRLEDAHPGARRELSSWELPRGLTRGLWAIDIAATGYAIHSDWEDEGPTQAVTSNAVPAVAAIAAGAASGAYMGGVVGSFIPVPGLGTAAGVVVGGVVGTAVGAFTSGAIDSLFESGADTLGDWGDAVADGVEEIGDTVSGVAEGVGDVFDSIF